MSTNNRNTHLTADEKMIVGVQQYLSKQSSFIVGSQTVTPADIVKVFQDRIALGKAIEPATAARTAAVKAYRDKRAQTASLVRFLKRFVQAMYAESPDTLAVFGLTILKVVPKMTIATKAAALQKSTATRAARHTMGSVQRKSVKGVAPVPATSPAPIQVPSATTVSVPAKPLT